MSQIINKSSKIKPDVVVSWQPKPILFYKPDFRTFGIKGARLVKQRDLLYIEFDDGSAPMLFYEITSVGSSGELRGHAIKTGRSKLLKQLPDTESIYVTFYDSALFATT